MNWTFCLRRVARTMLASTVAVSLLPFSSPVQASSPPPELWVGHYNGPGNRDDQAKAVAVDKAGNVFVIGTSIGEGTQSDYATIKYDSSGRQLWIARYDGPGNRSDNAEGLAVDEAGNAYVTGVSTGIDGTCEFATIKYDGIGNKIWEAHYRGPVGGSEGRAIAVDPVGNVYVTGHGRGDGTDYDYVTIKYDSSGSEQWVARYNGPDSRSDFAYALAIDALGAIYVTGASNGSGTLFGYFDYATVKYDSAGNQLWVARYGGPGAGYDGAYSIAVDGFGNAYVTGRSAGVSTGDDSLTVKYDADGAQQWVARYNGPGNGFDAGWRLALDTLGNIYVVGMSTGSGTGYDFAVIKYDGNGNQLWAARYNGPGDDDDEGRDILLDTAGHVYVTGISWGSNSGFDATTVMYDSVGTQQWVARYNGPANSDDYGIAIAVDDGGNLYVAGNRTDDPENSYDYLVVRYGSEFWAPFTPAGSGFGLTTSTMGGKTTVTADIAFSSSGYRVDDWASVTHEGSTYRVDATVSRWTGMSAQVVTKASNSYDLGALPTGSYTFEFWANGSLVKSLPVVVGSAGTPARKGTSPVKRPRLWSR